MAVAFLAGLLSFLSPCVLPLVPSYLSFITGASGVAELESRRHLALLHAALFVIGFSLIFIALGATATELGLLLKSWQRWLERLGGLLLVVFGLLPALQSPVVDAQSASLFPNHPASTMKSSAPTWARACCSSGPTPPAWRSRSWPRPGRWRGSCAGSSGSGATSCGSSVSRACC